MSESLLSVGLDVGTTTTQLVLSRLEIVNQAGSFAVPQMQITDRQILYRGPVHFTPLKNDQLVDGDAIKDLVEREYAQAGIEKSQVDTGAIIITGETSRKENAAAVLAALSGFAGDFVAATAGPHLESVLAAKGAGAVELSEKTGLPVLHMDIGGGTSNLALIRNGQILNTGCLNVGGRLIKRTPDGKISYVSPVLRGITGLQKGDCPQPGQLEGIAGVLVTALEMAAGLRPATQLLDSLMTREAGDTWTIPEETCMLSFSGGVADCMEKQYKPGQFGDMGVELGQAIRESRLCRGQYALGVETIRATVIGAGSHSAQLSGSTVFCEDVTLPVRNLPVVAFTWQEQDDPGLPGLIRQRIRQQDEALVILSFPGYAGASYGQITVLAEKLAAACRGGPVYVCLEADMAKALGQKLRLLLPPNTPCLCIDRVQLQQGSYLDVGKPVGPALPVVVKTLVLEGRKSHGPGEN